MTAFLIGFVLTIGGLLGMNYALWRMATLAKRGMKEAQVNHLQSELRRISERLEERNSPRKIWTRWDTLESMREEREKTKGK